MEKKLLGFLAAVCAFSVSWACKPRQNDAEVQSTTPDDWKPDPPPDQIEVGMSVDVCPKDFVCKYKAKRTGKWIVDSRPPRPGNPNVERVKIRSMAKTWRDEGVIDDRTYLYASGNHLRTTIKAENYFFIEKLEDGTYFIKHGEQCLTNRGYKQSPEFHPCDKNNIAQKMEWNPNTDFVDPNKSFIKNQNVCLDIINSDTTTLDNQMVIFFNCKDYGGAAGLNYNQRFRLEK